MKFLRSIKTILIIGVLTACQTDYKKDSVVQTTEIKDPLPSWNNEDTKSSIINYVTEVVNTDSKNFIEIADRLAVFDNDGNLWSEQPAYFQLFFAIDRVKAMVAEHPGWIEE